MVGGMPRPTESGALDRLLVPLTSIDGHVAAWVAAVPYLRLVDLPLVGERDVLDPIVEGVRHLYAGVLDAARTRRTSSQALIAMGHCYMTGGQQSELSERKVLMGNQHALPADIFPPDVSYVALGHLHRPQAVAGREEVRYSGSPIPMAMPEAAYEHQVVLVELQAGQVMEMRPLSVPRAVQFLKLPAQGPASVEAVLDLCRSLDPADGIPKERHPFIEVSLQLDAPEPGLRARVTEALKDRAARLVRIQCLRQGNGEALAESVVHKELADLLPEEVFRRCWASVHPGTPPAQMVAAFNQLVDELEREDLLVPATAGVVET
jgi:DNA repair protein SbcD/Mre11